MDKYLTLITALVGLITAIIAFRSNSNKVDQANIGKSENKDSAFKGLGAVLLAIIIYFTYMLGMVALPGLMTLAMNIGKEKPKSINIPIEMIIPKEKSNENLNNDFDYILLQSISLIENAYSRDEELTKALLNCLYYKKYTYIAAFVQFIHNEYDRDKLIKKCITEMIIRNEYTYIPILLKQMKSTYESEEIISKLTNEYFHKNGYQYMLYGN